MDFELEVAYILGGASIDSAEDLNPLGLPVPLEQAEDLDRVHQ